MMQPVEWCGPSGPLNAEGRGSWGGGEGGGSFLGGVTAHGEATPSGAPAGRAPRPQCKFCEHRVHAGVQQVTHDYCSSSKCL